MQNSFTIPELRDSSDSTIAGAIGPASTPNEIYRFRFAVFQSTETENLSATLNSNVALPFGGFPGSRRFK